MKYGLVEKKYYQRSIADRYLQYAQVYQGKKNASAFLDQLAQTLLRHVLREGLNVLEGVVSVKNISTTRKFSSCLNSSQQAPCNQMSNRDFSTSVF